MAAQCCKDSVAMKVIGVDPYEGMRVECRWGRLCTDGYAVYTKGAWVYSDALKDRIERNASPAQTAYHQARIKEILK